MIYDGEKWIKSTNSYLQMTVSVLTYCNHLNITSRVSNDATVILCIFFDPNFITKTKFYGQKTCLMNVTIMWKCVSHRMRHRAVPSHLISSRICIIISSVYDFVVSYLFHPTQHAYKVVMTAIHNNITSLYCHKIKVII